MLRGLLLSRLAKHSRRVIQSLFGFPADEDVMFTITRSHKSSINANKVNSELIAALDEEINRLRQLRSCFSMGELPDRAKAQTKEHNERGSQSADQRAQKEGMGAVKANRKAMNIYVVLSSLNPDVLRFLAHKQAPSAACFCTNELDFTYQESELQKIVQGIGASDPEILSARKFIEKSPLFRGTVSMFPSNI